MLTLETFWVDVVGFVLCCSCLGSDHRDCALLHSKRREAVERRAGKVGEATGVAVVGS